MTAVRIIKPSTTLDFSGLTLEDPVPLLGHSGFYLSKLLWMNEPCLIQLPECKTKQGILVTKLGKSCDLVYERLKHADLSTWLESLVYACQDRLEEKKKLWFQNDLSRDDIENMMVPVIRLYQTGKYFTFKVALTGQKNTGTIVYNENHIGLDIDTLTVKDAIIPLVQVEGIKFSSKSFELELKIAQIMVMNRVDDPTLPSACLIQTDNKFSTKPLKEQAKQLEQTKQLEQLKEQEQAKQLEQKQLQAKQEQAKQEQAKQLEQEQAKQLEQLQAKRVPINLQTNLDTDEEESLALTLKTDLALPDSELAGAKTDDVQEVNFDYAAISSDVINLKKPKEVYYEIYKAARAKAKNLRNIAMDAYLEANEIKSKYMLSDIIDEEESSSDGFSSEEEEEEEQEDS
jgi:hypothetical protein